MEEAKVDQEALDKELHSAIPSGDVEKVRSCIRKGANVNSFNEFGSTSLILAAGYGHTEVVKYLLSEGAQIDKQKDIIWTPLQVAVLHGHVNVVVELINAGANVDFDKNGTTAISIAISNSRWEIAKILVEHSNVPLSYFVKSNDIDVVKYLTSQKVDVNKPDDNNETPLSCAFQNENLEMVKHLLGNGAHFTVDLELIKFSRKNKLDFVQLLVSNGANVNRRNKENETPLIHAVKNKNVKMIEYLLENDAHFSIHTAFLESIDGGSKEIVELLINKGANVNQKYRSGLTPLLKAIEARNLELVKLLVENGADVNLMGGNGIIPLTESLMTKQSEVTYFLISKGAVTPDSFSLLIAGIEEKNFEMVETAIERGKNDVNTIDKQSGSTLLIKSVELNYREMVEYLIEKGANVNQVDQSGNTPLSIAISNDNLEIITLLISKGAHVKEYTPFLMSMIEKRNFQMCTFLIENGVNLDSTDESGLTPLTKSVQMDSYLLVQCLTQNGADVNQMDGHQDTALSVAASTSNMKIFDYLIQSGASIDIVREKLDKVAASNEDFAIYLETMTDERKKEKDDSKNDSCVSSTKRGNNSKLK